MDNSLQCHNPKCGRHRTVPLAIMERYGAPGRTWRCDLPYKDGGLEDGCKTRLNPEERPPPQEKRAQRPGSSA